MKIDWKGFFSNPITLILITGIVTFGASKYLYDEQHKDQQFDRLNDNLNKILDVDMQYPYVDDSTYIAHWNVNQDSNCDSSLRYQTYCEYIFDFMQDACEYYNYNRKDIEGFIDLEDMIAYQKVWWEQPMNQNSKAYPDKFKIFINETYKQMKP